GGRAAAGDEAAGDLGGAREQLRRADEDVEAARRDHERTHGVLGPEALDLEPGAVVLELLGGGRPAVVDADERHAAAARATVHSHAQPASGAKKTGAERSSTRTRTTEARRSSSSSSSASAPPP